MALIPVGEFLLRRLSQAGLGHLFGVPGDYTLGFLDQVMASPVQWTPTCNELDAAYAADGYARIKGIGALATTFGVGELSAINGIAGAFTEFVPVVEIVGMPPCRAIEGAELVHHSLGTGDFRAFQRMAAEVTVAQTILSAQNAVTEIDRVLSACLRACRPVHIGLPADVAGQLIDVADAIFTPPQRQSDAKALEAFTTDARMVLHRARRPLILADFLIDRWGVTAAVAALIEAGNWPYATLGLGRGLLDEGHPQFVGVYTGALSLPVTRAAMDEADCLIEIGVRLSDSLTGAFSTQLPSSVVRIEADYAEIEGRRYDGIAVHDALMGLIEIASSRPCLGRETSGSVSRAPISRREAPRAKEPVTQAKMWERLGALTDAGDILAVEQGTSFFASILAPLPGMPRFIAQPIWGSIGYTLPALLGTGLAAPDKRQILVIGDGSFQLTAQDLSSFGRYDVAPVIFLIENDGYAIERIIRSPQAAYHEIPRWDYAGVIRALCAEHKVTIVEVQTIAALDEALADLPAHPEHPWVIRVKMDRLEAPPLLHDLAEMLSHRNTASAKDVTTPCAS